MCLNKCTRVNRKGDPTTDTRQLQTHRHGGLRLHVLSSGPPDDEGYELNPTRFNRVHVLSSIVHTFNFVYILS